MSLTLPRHKPGRSAGPQLHRATSSLRDAI